MSSLSANGAACQVDAVGADASCASGQCKQNKEGALQCAPNKSGGSQCTDAAECYSGVCSTTCTLSPLEGPCESGSDCAENRICFRDTRTGFGDGDCVLAPGEPCKEGDTAAAASIACITDYCSADRKCLVQDGKTLMGMCPETTWKLSNKENVTAAAGPDQYCEHGQCVSNGTADFFECGASAEDSSSSSSSSAAVETAADSSDSKPATKPAYEIRLTLPTTLKTVAELDATALLGDLFDTLKTSDWPSGAINPDQVQMTACEVADKGTFKDKKLEGSGVCTRESRCEEVGSQCPVKGVKSCKCPDTIADAFKKANPKTAVAAVPALQHRGRAAQTDEEMTVQIEVSMALSEADAAGMDAGELLKTVTAYVVDQVANSEAFAEFGIRGDEISAVSVTGEGEPVEGTDGSSDMSTGAAAPTAVSTEVLLVALALSFLRLW